MAFWVAFSVDFISLQGIMRAMLVAMMVVCVVILGALVLTSVRRTGKLQREHDQEFEEYQREEELITERRNAFRKIAAALADVEEGSENEARVAASLDALEPREWELREVLRNAVLQNYRREGSVKRLLESRIVAAVETEARAVQLKS